MDENLKRAAFLIKGYCTSRVTCKGCPFERPPVNRGPGVNSTLLRYKCKIADVPEKWHIIKED